MRISDWSSDVCSSDLGKVNSDIVVRKIEIFPRKYNNQYNHKIKQNECNYFRFYYMVYNISRQPVSGLSVVRSEEHTSELQSLMRISYAVLCLKQKKKILHK